MDPRATPSPAASAPTSKAPLKEDESGSKPADAMLKGQTGLRRVIAAGRYSLLGLRAAWRHEAAFRQEIVIGIPFIVFAAIAAPGAWQKLALIGSIMFAWIVELLNSAIEAVADAVSLEHHPLLGRAKDLGSAAVLVSLIFAAVTWGVVWWPL